MENPADCASLKRRNHMLCASWISAVGKCDDALRPHLTHYWRKADFPRPSVDVRFPGVKRTSQECTAMSAFDPKRTSAPAMGSIPLINFCPGSF